MELLVYSSEVQQKIVLNCEQSSPAKQKIQPFGLKNIIVVNLISLKGSHTDFLQHWENAKHFFEKT